MTLKEMKIQLDYLISKYGEEAHVLHHNLDGNPENVNHLVVYHEEENVLDKTKSIFLEMDE